MYILWINWPATSWRYHIYCDPLNILTYPWTWDQLERVWPQSSAWRPAGRVQWTSAVWKTMAARASSRTTGGVGVHPKDCPACLNRWPCFRSGRLRWTPPKAPARRPSQSWPRNNAPRNGAEAHSLVAILLPSILLTKQNKIQHIIDYQACEILFCAARFNQLPSQKLLGYT